MKSVAIIIVNWNNWEDTLECLDSLISSDYNYYNIFLVDNGSEDESVKKIKEWAKMNNINFLESSGTTDNFRMVTKYKSLFLIKLNDNLGFAGGNNIAIKYAVQENYNYVYLLNNDTTIKSDGISEIVEACEDQNYRIATSRIFYYDQPNLLWNAGGELDKFGSRKYYTNQKYANFPQNKRRVRRITFATGCALLINTSLIKKVGALTEDFFFGEEDYEYSMRLKVRNIKIGCVDSSIVYHKVSSSSKTLFEKKVNNGIIYYINRIVSMKKYYLKLYWIIWRKVILFKIISIFFLKYKVSLRESYQAMKFINSKGKKLNQVSKAFVLDVKSGNWKKGNGK